MRREQRDESAATASAKRASIGASARAADQFAQHRAQAAAAADPRRSGPARSALPASACSQTAAQAASKAGMPCASSPAMMPDKHVARPGGGEPGRAVAVDRGAAVRRRDHRVRRPCRRRRHRHVGRRRRAGPASTALSSPAMSGNSRANSPSCGVSTSGRRIRPTRAEEASRPRRRSAVSASASSTSAATRPADAVEQCERAGRAVFVADAEARARARAPRPAFGQEVAQLVQRCRLCAA